MPKSTDAEMERRITAVHGLLLNGATRADVIAHAAKETEKKAAWNVDERQIDQYIARARKLIRTASKANRDYQLGMARQRLNLLFSRAMAIMDYKTALSVQKEINTLEALHAPPAAQTIKLTGMDTREFNDLIDALEAAGIEPSSMFRKLKERAQTKREA